MKQPVLPQPYKIRPAARGDAAVIAHHRVEMFRDMGQLRGDAEEAALTTASRALLDAALPSGKYLGWVIESAGAVVAGGGLVLQRPWPGPEMPAGGEEAYVLNVYVEPAHRRLGLARALMEAMLSWCRERGVARVGLHASDEGRPLYEALGFASTNEMRLEMSADRA